MKKVVLASGNKGKLKEFSAMFVNTSYDDEPIEVLPQSFFNVSEADETGLSFIENAIIKARNAAIQTGLPAIADDSGLEVDALQGQPGIYSARYSQDIYGTDANDSTNNKKLLDSLIDVNCSNRCARFVCALAFMRNATDPTPIVCTGLWQGRLLEAPKGENGFGYDPLFYIEEFSCTSAELDSEVKRANSHRGKAIALLRLELQRRGYLKIQTT